jgi:hypothetical protein
MRNLISLLTLLLLALVTEAKTLNVLFIGNSYTYVNGVPEIIKTMAEAKGHQLNYEMQAPGGYNFEKHWQDKTAAQKIENGNFDAVVLQNQSFEPVYNPDNMMKYGGLLAAVAKKAGARVVYYQTMAYKAPMEWMKEDSDSARRGMKLFPEMHERLVESYNRLADAAGGEIAPVGEAWKLSYEAMPDVRLHDAKNSHSAIEGAYLTALVLFATLFDEEPAGMPAQIDLVYMKKGEEKTADIRLSPEVLKGLETAATKAWRQYAEVNARRTGL